MQNRAAHHPAPDKSPRAGSSPPRLALSRIARPQVDLEQILGRQRSLVQPVGVIEDAAPHRTLKLPLVAGTHPRA